MRFRVAYVVALAAPKNAEIEFSVSRNGYSTVFMYWRYRGIAHLGLRPLWRLYKGISLVRPPVREIPSDPLLDHFWPVTLCNALCNAPCNAGKFESGRIQLGSNSRNRRYTVSCVDSPSFSF